MAWGKEEFRTKYKESNDCFKKIKDNYYDLDYEYQMISKQLQQKENIIKEVREKLNTQLAFTSSYQLNYQSAMNIIEETKSILDKES